MKYLAIGRIHPERADVNIKIPPMRPATGGEISIYCEASQLTVTLVDQPVDGYIAAYILAEHIAQSVVSALGYALATGYVVELVEVIEDSGAVHVFGTRAQELMFDPFEPKFSQAVNVVGSDIAFRMAIADYSTALRDSFRCASLCFRAIEAIKSAFDGDSDAKKWANMHISLGTTRGNIDTDVKAFADPIRHGDWANIPSTSSEQRLRMLSVTRDVLDRYLNFRQPMGVSAA